MNNILSIDKIKECHEAISTEVLEKRAIFSKQDVGDKALLGKRDVLLDNERDALLDNERDALLDKVNAYK